MADKNLEIKVVTTADTTGLRQTEVGLDRILKKQVEVDAATRAARGAALRGALAPVPPGLQLPGEGTFRRVYPPAAPAAPSEADGGIPFGRTSIRALGALFGTFVAGAIKDMTEQINKGTEAVNKQGEETGKLAHQWHDAALASREIADTSKIAQAAAKEIEEAYKNAQKANEEELPLWQQAADQAEKIASRLTDPGRVPTFEKQRQERVKGLLLEGERLRAAAAGAIRESREVTRAMEELKSKPLDESIRKTQERLNELTLQLSHTANEDVQSYANITKEIQRATRELAELQKMKAAQAALPVGIPGLTLREQLKSANLPIAGLTPLEEKQIRDAFIERENKARDEFMKNQREAPAKAAAELQRRQTEGFTPEQVQQILKRLDKMVQIWQ